MLDNKFPEIRDLAIIGDRRTAAIITTKGAIVWYCPDCFDCPSLLAALLDLERGGAWTLQSPDTMFARRQYLGDSGVLETTFTTSGSEWRVTDWMPLGKNLPCGICRKFSPVSSEVTVTLQAAPDYGRRLAQPQDIKQAVQIDERYYLYASHQLMIEGECISFTIPQGEPGWAALVNAPLTAPTQEKLDSWLQTTLESWQQVSSHTVYHGFYEREVTAAIRALRLLTFEESGGIIAAATTSLPEVIGGKRNYDYRYVWLRDAGMIVSSLTRAGSDGTEERRFLHYICVCGRNSNPVNLPLTPFSRVNGEAAPGEKILDLAGYQASQPVIIGNGANEQLQLDGYGHLLLAAHLIYSHFDTREHWSLITRIGDFLAAHWSDPDHGVWEEKEKRHYTAGKVIVACGLDLMAQFAAGTQAQRWRSAVRDIRHFVAEECLNSEGAYAAIAGGEAVDVSAALFPVWGYTAADAPEMVATMTAVERDLATGHLYRRHLEQFDAQKEGVFLAGTFWVAQYWVMRRDFQRVHSILDAALEYANDLGLFAEEADPKTGQMLGNFPQTFVHSAFIRTVIDLKAALD